MATLLLTLGTALVISARTPQPTVFVGEPVKLVLSWEGTGLSMATYEQENAQRLVFLVERDGKPFGEYHEYPHGVAGDAPPRPKSQQRVVMTNLILLAGTYGQGPRALFPSPGRYTVRVHVTDSKSPADSGPVEFLVEAPQGRDAAALAEVREKPLFYLGVDLESFADRFSDTRYARLPLLWRSRASFVKARRSESHPGDDRRAIQRAQATAALEDLNRVEWGGFEEEALQLKADWARLGGDSEAADRFEGELIARLPESKAARALVLERAVAVPPSPENKE